MNKLGTERIPEVADLPFSSFLAPSQAVLLRRLLSPPRTPAYYARLDRFDILEPIGMGGMGLVLLARDSRNQGKAKSKQESTDSVPSSHDGGSERDGDAGLVAVKLLKPELLNDPRAVRSFLKEAKHQQRLDHPNILTVLEVPSQTEKPYYVMPYLPRGSLARLIRIEASLDMATVLKIARQVASALICAHERLLIHRDLKPANILLDKEGNAYLTDFGLARPLFNDSLSGATRACHEGTAPYMSPAVAAGKGEDTRRDIYAFGAVLYEMLSGRPPYDGTPPEVILA